MICGPIPSLGPNRLKETRYCDAFLAGPLQTICRAAEVKHLVLWYCGFCMPIVSTNGANTFNPRFGDGLIDGESLRNFISMTCLEVSSRRLTPARAVDRWCKRHSLDHCNLFRTPRARWGPTVLPWTKSAWSDSLRDNPGLKGGSLNSGDARTADRIRQLGLVSVSWSDYEPRQFRLGRRILATALQLVLIEGGFDTASPRRSASPINRPGGGCLRCQPVTLLPYAPGWATSRCISPLKRQGMRVALLGFNLSLREFLLLEMRERVPDHCP